MKWLLIKFLYSFACIDSVQEFLVFFKYIFRIFFNFTKCLQIVSKRKNTLKLRSKHLKKIILYN